MPRIVKASFVLLLGWAALPASAAAQLVKPPTRTLTPIVGPATLSATASGTLILLIFPAVQGASAYRVTRTNNAGDPETPIYEGPAADPGIANATCVPPDMCAFKDTAVKVGYLYSYRVYSLFPNPSGPPIVSPPSPVASAQLKLARIRD